MAASGSAARLSSSTGRLGVFIGAESGRASLATILAVACAAGGSAVLTITQGSASGPKPRFCASMLRRCPPAAVASQLAREYGAAAWSRPCPWPARPLRRIIGGDAGDPFGCLRCGASAAAWARMSIR